MYWLQFQGIPDWKCSVVADQFIACGKPRDVAHELVSQIWLAVLDNLEENERTFLLLKRLALEADVSCHPGAICNCLLSCHSAEPSFCRFFFRIHTQDQSKCGRGCLRSCSRTSVTAWNTGITAMCCRLPKTSFSPYPALGYVISSARKLCTVFRVRKLAQAKDVFSIVSDDHDRHNNTISW